MNTSVDALSNGPLIELNDREIEEVSGGSILDDAIAAAKAAAAKAEKLGEELGRELYNALH